MLILNVECFTEESQQQLGDNSLKARSSVLQDVI